MRGTAGPLFLFEFHQQEEPRAARNRGYIKYFQRLNDPKEQRLMLELYARLPPQLTQFEHFNCVVLFQAAWGYIKSLEDGRPGAQPLPSLDPYVHQTQLCLLRTLSDTLGLPAGKSKDCKVAVAEACKNLRPRLQRVLTNDHF